jgi:hypothetical protein
MAPCFIDKAQLLPGDPVDRLLIRGSGLAAFSRVLFYSTEGLFLRVSPSRRKVR